MGTIFLSCTLSFAAGPIVVALVGPASQKDPRKGRV